jgi:hypothetical protein
MSEAQKPVTDDYRREWERIFGPELAYGMEQGREEYLRRNQARLDACGDPVWCRGACQGMPVNPNDAQEHPPAD